MTATRLKPCPFCGGTFVAQGASRGYISVWCGCGARGPETVFPEICVDPAAAVDECRAAWNRRAPDPVMDAARAILKDIGARKAIYEQKRDAANAFGDDNYNRHGLFSHTVEAFEHLEVEIAREFGLLPTKDEDE